MISSYLVLAIAIVTVLAIKYFLVNRSYQNKMSCYVDPKQLAVDIIIKTIKDEGEKILREKYRFSNLTGVIQGNLAYLRTVEPGEKQDIVIQKLRNICLCIELGLDKQVASESEISKFP